MTVLFGDDDDDKDGTEIEIFKRKFELIKQKLRKLQIKKIPTWLIGNHQLCNEQPKLEDQGRNSIWACNGPL